MNKQNLLILMILVFYCQNIFAQVSFLGFDQQECEIISDYGYSTQTIQCGEHATEGYALSKDSIKIFSKCISDIPIYVRKFMMVNDTSGFIVEDWTMVYKIYTTEDSWIHQEPFCGVGGEIYFGGFFLISPNTGYLILFNWGGDKLTATRTSNIRSRTIDLELDNPVVILQDTVFGDPYCELDTLSFRIKNGIDTTHFKIILNQFNSSIEEKQNLLIGISPNPVTSYFGFYNYVTYEQIDKISIFDFSGRMICSLDPSSSNKYYVGNLKNGLYFVELMFNHNKKVFKMIKI